ncbi:MAG: hypothetical protein QNJ45_00355 [Ardenticatenaceae bacterium]|nr:hypothetical protein [Ardenticatenaceae bacterium]
MTTSEERMKILTMIENGKISAAEGAELLKSIGGPGQTPAVKEEQGYEPKRLRLRVIDQNGEKRININLPIGLVKVGLKMGAKLGTSVEGISEQELLTAIRQAVQEGTKGTIATIDTKNGEVLEVLVE